LLIISSVKEVPIYRDSHLEAGPAFFCRCEERDSSLALGTGSAISVGGNEIAAPRQVGARNDKRERVQNDRKSEGLTKIVLFCH
jgi:hypothetical protein